MIRILSCLCLVLFCGSVAAETSQVSSPLLKNRFRLDPNIEEVSLVIYREEGSAPAILIQPDGGKIYASRHPENVKWYDELDFDLVTIQQPMPGPWQIVGAVDYRNRIIILSDLQLVLDQQYDTLFKGERLKVTARVLNNNEMIDLQPFLKKMELDVWARMEGLNESYSLDVTGEKLASYYDNGEGMDAYANDGLFTGDLQIVVNEGQYQVIFQAHNPTFERQFTLPLRVLAPPATIKFSYENERPVSMSLSVTEKLLKPETIAFNSDVVGSQGVRRSYAAKSMDEVVSLQDITQPGDYTVSTRMFATTLDGREIMVDLAKQRFSLAGSGVDPKDVLASQGIQVEDDSAQEGEMQSLVDEVTSEFHQGVATLKQLNQPKEGLNWWWVIGINVILLLAIVGVVVFFKMRSLRTAQLRAVSNLSNQKKNVPAGKNSADNDPVDLMLPED